MRSNFFRGAVLLIAAFCLISISERSTVQAAGEPSGPVSGKTAFWAMYKSAYSWSSDAVPLKLESKSISGVKNEGGKAAMWTAIFGSARKREAIDISYAVAAQAPDVAKGINVGHPISWGGPSRDVMPFQGSDIAADSDAAYKTAATLADSWLKTHPDKQVSFLLGFNTTTFVRPVWVVMWGDKKFGFRAFVDAKTGEIAKPLK